MGQKTDQRSLVSAVAAAGLLILAPASGLCQAKPGAATGVISPQEVRILVPNQMGSSVSILDGEGTLLVTVDLRAFGFSEHAMPHQVAAEPDGSAWYATLVGDNHIVKFDGSGRLVARTEFEAPGMIVLDPTRDRLYVSRALSAMNPPSSLGVFRTSDLELVEEAEIFISRPHALAVDTVSGFVYSGSLAGDQLATFDPDGGDVWLTRAGAPNGFVGLATSPDGSRLVATTQLTDRLLAFDAASPGPLPLIASIPVEPAPYDVAFSPDGRSVWFPNQRAGSITRVDTGSWTVSAAIRHETFVEPHGVVLTPDSRFAYVTSHGRPFPPAGEAAPAGPDFESPRANGTLAVIDAASGQVLKVTEVGPYAAAPGLAVRRDSPPAPGKRSVRISR